MNHLDLCAGIGGFSIAAGWAGFITKVIVEINPVCQAWLRSNYPHADIHGDIKAFGKDSCNEKFTLATAGFSCQPHSTSGRRLGREDHRYLGDEAVRVVDELRPTWFIGENVDGIINMVLDDILADLESLGYATRTFVIPAGAVGESHERNRVFIVAHSTGIGQQGQGGHKQPIYPKKVPDREASRFVDAFQRNALPYLCKDHDGIPSKLAQEELRAYGNAVNPYQVYPILKCIAEIEAAA